jgi:ribosomal protein S18 acetylase RimI-like enzyme
MTESAAPGLEFRIARPEDEAGLAALFDQLDRVGDFANFHPHPLDAANAKRVAGYAGKDLYYIAVRGADVIGYGLLRGWDERYEVPSLGIAIAPGARGSGLGRAFMHFLHAAAQARGAPRVRLKVYPHNVAALTLYRSLGYAFDDTDGDELIGLLPLQRDPAQRSPE